MKTKEFVVMARVMIECDLTIKAESLEDAIAKARTLKELDFIDIKGEFMEGELHVKGVFEL